MPPCRARIPGSPTKAEGCFASLHCRSLFPAVPTPLWYEQGQTAIPHLRPLPVEPQLPSPDSLGPHDWHRWGPAAFAGLPAALLPRLLAPARQAAVSAGEDPVSQRCCHAAARCPDPCPGACRSLPCSCRQPQGAGGVPWLLAAPGTWPEPQQWATVYKSPLAAPGGKPELAGKDAAVTEGASGAGAGSCREDGDVGAAGPGPAPALPHGWQPCCRVLPGPESAGAEPESEDAVAGFCQLSACPSSVGRMGPLLPPGWHRCFPEP